MRAEIPLQLQLLAALERGPRAVGYYGDTAQRLKTNRWLPRIEGDDLSNALDGQRRLVVAGLQRRADHGRMFDRGVDHAIDFRVHAVDSLAADDVGEVVDPSLFTDIAPGAARLERQRFRLGDGQFRSGGDERSICGATIRRLVHDLV